jgi:hypothetical protein
MLSGAGAIRYGRLGHGEDRPHTIGIADIKQHSFGNNASHFTRLQIDDEQCLFALDLAGIGALLLEAGNDGSRMIAEIDGKRDQFVGAGNICDGLDGADADVELIQNVESDGRFDGSGSHSNSRTGLGRDYSFLDDGQERGLAQACCGKPVNLHFD